VDACIVFGMIRPYDSTVWSNLTAAAKLYIIASLKSVNVNIFRRASARFGQYKGDSNITVGGDKYGIREEKRFCHRYRFRQ